MGNACAKNAISGSYASNRATQQPYRATGPLQQPKPPAAANSAGSLLSEEAQRLSLDADGAIHIHAANHHQSHRVSHSAAHIGGCKYGSRVSQALMNGSKISDAYTFGAKLGDGAFSDVYLAVEKATGVTYAIKIMELPAAPDGPPRDREMTKQEVLDEIRTVGSLDHPSILKVKEYFVEGRSVFLVTELLTGGELLEAILAHGSYSELEARTCFRQVLEGVAYLHARGVVHRDLKLENLLLARPGDISHVKISDFGLALSLHRHSDRSHAERCGTPLYLAPEVLAAKGAHCEYTPAVDMWALGIILYMMLSGMPPFFGDNDAQMFRQILRGSYDFDDEVWKPVSGDAKQLITRLMDTDPKKRLTAHQALQHPWVQQASASFLSSRALPGTQENFRRRSINAPVSPYAGAAIALNV